MTQIVYIDRGQACKRKIFGTLYTSQGQPGNKILSVALATHFLFLFQKRNQEVPEKNGQEFSMIQDAAKANDFKPLFTSNQKTTVNAWGVGEGCPLILVSSPKPQPAPKDF